MDDARVLALIAGVLVDLRHQIRNGRDPEDAIGVVLLMLRQQGVQPIVGGKR